MNGKYVIFERHGLEYPILLPDEHFVSHNEITVFSDKVVSAGKWYFSGGEVSVFGESVSLKVKSRPEDANLINKAYFNVESWYWQPARNGFQWYLTNG